MVRSLNIFLDISYEGRVNFRSLRFVKNVNQIYLCYEI